MNVAVSAPQSMLRPTWAEINLSAFEKNLRAVAGVLSPLGAVPAGGTALSPGVRMLVVLKADGYGHGALALAKASAGLSGLPFWGFGVSSVEEGVALREAGFSQRVLILGSLYPFEAFEVAVKHDLTPTVASRLSAQALAKVANGLAAACPST